MSGSSPFETKLVRIINDHLTTTKQPGLAYRLKNSRFFTQYLDVIVDSSSKAHYLGIECKSLQKGTDKLYFSSYFTTDKKGVHQITRIREYLEKTCRFGILAVEVRAGRGGGIPNDIYLIPFFHIQRAFGDGQKGIHISEITSRYPRLQKLDNGWNFDAVISALRQF